MNNFGFQVTAEAGEQPVLLPAAPSNNKEMKKRKGAPVGQRNAYQIFLKKECARLRACREASLDGTNIRRKATDAWKNMSEIEKQPYVDESKKSKEKYKEEANEAMITNNKQPSVEDVKEENRTSFCGDYRVTSQPEADNSLVNAQLGITLKMAVEVPKESLEEWDTYLSLDLPTGESK
ncbi:uncharacterized protein LOC130721155 [Lotus japonicus]|uniref:uncharacterized protein LOC130721155 n=1 Tax=Lotus japonicus TaxID=34305 RepID=UPI002589A043|nr:uncharacterized protein LOC130721155 [Lotus japonicus]